MQRIPFRIGCKKPATVWAIEDEMSGDVTDDSPTRLFEILCEGQIRWKAKMT
jgi:hypothetical protein